MTKTKAYIDYILDLMRSGDVKREIVLAKFVKKWQTSDRTFDRYWNIANEAYNIELEAINKTKQEETLRSELEAVKRQNITKQSLIESLEKECIEIQNTIERGYLVKKVNIDGKIELIKEIFKSYEFTLWNKMLADKRESLKKLQGWDAPKQIEQKNTFEDLKFKGIIIEK